MAELWVDLASQIWEEIVIYRLLLLLPLSPFSFRSLEATFPLSNLPLFSSLFSCHSPSDLGTHGLNLPTFLKVQTLCQTPKPISNLQWLKFFLTSKLQYLDSFCFQNLASDLEKKMFRLYRLKEIIGGGN